VLMFIESLFPRDEAEKDHSIFSFSVTAWSLMLGVCPTIGSIWANTLLSLRIVINFASAKCSTFKLLSFGC
jgi:hypothetical protein